MIMPNAMLSAIWITHTLKQNAPVPCKWAGINKLLLNSYLPFCIFLYLPVHFVTVPPRQRSDGLHAKKQKNCRFPHHFVLFLKKKMIIQLSFTSFQVKKTDKKLVGCHLRLSGHFKTIWKHLSCNMLKILQKQFSLGCVACEWQLSQRRADTYFPHSQCILCRSSKKIPVLDVSALKARF